MESDCRPEIYSSFFVLPLLIVADERNLITRASRPRDHLGRRPVSWRQCDRALAFAVVIILFALHRIKKHDVRHPRHNALQWYGHKIWADKGVWHDIIIILQE